MTSDPWTDAEYDLIVADYFVMLADDIAGRRYKMARASTDSSTVAERPVKGAGRVQAPEKQLGASLPRRSPLLFPIVHHAAAGRGILRVQARAEAQGFAVKSADPSEIRYCRGRHNDTKTISWEKFTGD